ncbi:MAG: GTP 3',8-cyclase MoaA [Deltaproteobacteria bacterium]|nr:GTP 3',8-cyclase MoaA [Deltaproteobacteria bacterium]
MLQDNHGRTVNYARISITDHCNFRCLYCHPQKNWTFMPHEHILRYEEILRLMRILVGMGVGKVRLTGGEPFARRDFVPFLGRVRAQFPELDLRLTTNASLVGPYVPTLKDMGIECLNISLDTWRRERFEEITGRDGLPEVLVAIELCEKHGLAYKLNAVALRGMNEDEVGDFISFATEHGVDVRFIEFMPIGDGTVWGKDRYWPASEILAEARKHADLTPDQGRDRRAGPARMFRIGSGPGRVGVISAVSCHFCSTCNRLRITADGRLRTCLFSDREYRLRSALRSPRLGDEAIERIIVQANKHKPLGFRLLEKREAREGVCRTGMSSIGG